MAEDIAISVNDVSKMYKLYDNPMDRLKESLGLSRKKKGIIKPISPRRTAISPVFV